MDSDCRLTENKTFLDDVENEFYFSDNSHVANDFKITSTIQKSRRSSISLKNLSSIHSEENKTPLKPKPAKSLANIKERSVKNRYSHVESKVKQYRLNIRQEHLNNKRKKESNCNINNLEVYQEKVDKKSNIKDVDELIKNIEDLEIENSVLKENNRKYIEQHATDEIRLDYFRTENSRLTDQLSMFKNTPNVSRRMGLNNCTPIKIINNPIKTPGATFVKTPLANHTNYMTSDSDINTSDLEETSSEDEIQADKTENIAQQIEDSDISQHSDQPLLRPKVEDGRRKSLGAMFCKILNNCKKNTTEITVVEPKKKKKKILWANSKNKVHPGIVMSVLHTPSTSKRQVHLSQHQTPVVPKIVIETTASCSKESSFLNTSRKSGAKVLFNSKNNLQNSIRKMLNTNVDFQNLEALVQVRKKEDIADLAVAYANGVLERTEQFKKKILDLKVDSH